MITPLFSTEFLSKFCGLQFFSKYSSLYNSSKSLFSLNINNYPKKKHTHTQTNKTIYVPVVVVFLNIKLADNRNNC